MTDPKETPDQKKSEEEAEEHAPEPAKGDTVEGQPGTDSDPETGTPADVAPETVGDGPATK